MYKGIWLTDIFYQKGHVIFHINSYYICSQSHTSSFITAPTKEDIYWILITDDVIKNITPPPPPPLPPTRIPQITILPPMQTIQTLQNLLEPIEETKETFEQKRLKRKLDKVEFDLEEYNKKKQKINHPLTLRESLLLLNVNVETKSHIIQKYDSMKSMTESDKGKMNTWLKIVSKIPFGINKKLPVKSDSLPDIKDFLDTVKQKLDDAVHGHDAIKNEISQFVAKCITNPDSNGRVLALCGEKGTGKTKLIKSGLADALGLPFFQINFGGLNDVSVLTGHDSTYVGSKPGKIVDILTKANCMNPIIYLDEIDKISEAKRKEIYGFLTHLLDPEQNYDFNDNYLAEIKLDLSKVFFVLSFNDKESVDGIASDRMKIIKIPDPTILEKQEICKKYIIPQLCKDIGIKYSLPKLNEIEAKNEADKKNIPPKKQKHKKEKTKNLEITISDDIIHYILKNKVETSPGLRQAKHVFETILNYINLQYLVQNEDFKDNPIQITKDIVDKIVFDFHKTDSSIQHIYM